MRISGLVAATVATFSTALPAQALVLFSNYTPSQTDFVQTGGAYPVKRRLPDASQSFDTSVRVQEYQVGFVCCTFRFESVATQFVAPTTFTAASIVVPLRHVSSVGNRNMGINIERLDGSNWVAAGVDSYAIVPSLTTGVITEVEARFGLNLTNLPENFAARPITFEAGETYRIRMAYSAGGIGSVDWFLSDQAASTGQSQRFYNYQSPTTLDFQPAFALTDGTGLNMPVPPVTGSVPEPASWAMLIIGFGLVGSAARRRRFSGQPRVAASILR
jgi:hypothetical protein